MELLMNYHQNAGDQICYLIFMYKIKSKHKYNRQKRSGHGCLKTIRFRNKPYASNQAVWKIVHIMQKKKRKQINSPNLERELQTIQLNT